MMLLVFFLHERSPAQDDCGWYKGDEIGRVCKKCKEATCYLQDIEPYSPWSNFTKREVRELKKKVLLFLMIKCCFASTLVPVLMWGL